MVIIGIDPGETSGWAAIRICNGRPRLLDYGLIPRLAAGQSGLLSSVMYWLDNLSSRFDIESVIIVYEEVIKSYKINTRIESTEVRGIIRHWCNKYLHGRNYSILPVQVRSQLGVPTKGSKKNIALFIERVFGFKPTGPSHVTDAIAVALAQAVRSNFVTRL